MDRESDGKVGGQLLEQLVSAFEDLETQSAGILQFLKAKGLATDEELAPYLQQAGDASNVRWRAARLRMDALLAAAIADAEEEFARKMEERARALDKSNAQKEEGQGGARQKPASTEGIDAQKADARKTDAAEQTQAPSAGSAEDVVKGTKETVGANKKVAEANTDTASGKEKTASEAARSDIADSTNQKVA